MKKIFNPITYGILRFRQLWGGLFGPDPENKVKVNWWIWNLVPVMIWIKLVNRQNFKLLAVLPLEIWCHKISSPEGNESLRFDIYPLDSSKIWKITFYVSNHLFWPKIIPLHFPGFQEKHKISYVQFFKMSRFKNYCSNPLVNRLCWNSAKMFLTGEN